MSRRQKWQQPAPLDYSGEVREFLRRSFEKEEEVCTCHRYRYNPHSPRRSVRPLSPHRRGDEFNPISPRRSNQLSPSHDLHNRNIYNSNNNHVILSPQLYDDLNQPPPRWVVGEVVDPSSSQQYTTCNLQTGRKALRHQQENAAALKRRGHKRSVSYGGHVIVDKPFVGEVKMGNAQGGETKGGKKGGGGGKGDKRAVDPQVRDEERERHTHK